MWETRQFLARSATAYGMSLARARLDDWIKRNGANSQWREVFVSNGYAVEFRPLVNPRNPR